MASHGVQLRLSNLVSKVAKVEKSAAGVELPKFKAGDTVRVHVRIKEGDLDLQLHYNDCGSGSETVVMLHGSGPGASGELAQFRGPVEAYRERYGVN